MREKISYFFHVCWYSQSAAYTSLAFGATRSGWWMNGQAFTILNTSCLSEFSRIIAAKTLKKAVSLTNNDVQTFLEGVEVQYSKRKTESCVFSGFGVSISDGWEWKSTTGRFASGRFGRLPERLLLSVRTKSINENFVNWKLRPLLFL